MWSTVYEEQCTMYNITEKYVHRDEPIEHNILYTRICSERRNKQIG